MLEEEDSASAAASTVGEGEEEDSASAFANDVIVSFEHKEGDIIVFFILQQFNQSIDTEQ
jgi:hypothetical protein